MFAILYKRSDDIIQPPLRPSHEEVQSSLQTGPWRVDTAKDGSVEQYEELQMALDRVNGIRAKGGEAALAVLIE